MNTYGNENIQIRDLIAKNEDIIKEALDNKLCDELYDLYFLFKTNEKYLGSLYATSYIYKKSINGEKENVESNRLKRIIESKTMGDSLDIYTFCDMCKDNINFKKLRKSDKRKLFLNAKEDLFLRENIELYNYDFLYHMLFFNKNLIMKKYEKNSKEFDNFNEVLDETAINASYFISNLAYDDYDNYVKIFNELADIYYKYNSYLMENGIDIKTNDIEHTLYYTRMIDMRKNDLLKESMGNSDVIDSFVKDYIKYEILPKEVKDKINNVELDRNNRNSNTKIREFLWEYFSDIDEFDDENIEKYDKYINAIEESDIYDDIIDVIYNDTYSIISYEYLVNSNKAFEGEYEYIKSFNDIEEFKMALQEDKITLLNYATYSADYYKTPFLDKRNIIYDLDENGVYSESLNDVYKDDKNYYIKKPSINYIETMYKEVYKDCCYDPLSALINVKSTMTIDILDLKKRNKKEYFDIMYDLLKEYQIYKISSSNDKIYEKDNDILDKINNNMNDFINNIDTYELDYILNEYLVYYSLPLEEKENLKSNLINKQKSGKVKLIKRKNS